MAQMPVADLGDALGHIGRLKQLLDIGEPGFADRLLAKHKEGEDRFRARGYAVWPAMSRHPYAGALATFREVLAGRAAIEDPVVQARLLPLAEDAYAVDAFNQDWQERPSLLAARLRSPRECFKALFELRTGLQLRNQGHDVEYLAIKHAGLAGPDLSLRGDPEIQVECVLAGQDGGRSIPVTASMEVGVQLLQAMERQSVHRIVFISTDRKFGSADTGPLLVAIKPALTDDSPRQLDALDGKYRIAIVGGGSLQSPLSTAEAEQLMRALHESPVRWGIMNPLSTHVLVPDRWLLRGVSIKSTKGDQAIKHLADAALNKAGQYKCDRPLVIAAGFGMPLMEDQARTEMLGLALQQCLGSSLERRPNVSGIAFVFSTGWHAEPVIGGRGVTEHAKAATGGHVKSGH